MSPTRLVYAYAHRDEIRGLQKIDDAGAVEIRSRAFRYPMTEPRPSAHSRHVGQIFFQRAAELGRPDIYQVTKGRIVRGDFLARVRRPGADRFCWACALSVSHRVKPSPSSAKIVCPGSPPIWRLSPAVFPTSLLPPVFPMVCLSKCSATRSAGRRLFKTRRLPAAWSISKGNCRLCNS